MKKYLLYTLFIGSSFFYFILLGNTAGGPAQSTGAPGEATCGRSGCHAVAENQGDATIELQFNEGATNYVANEVYPMTVSLSNLQEEAKNGFQIVALDSLDNNIGSWELTNETTTQIRAGNSLSDRNYVTHTRDGVAQTSWDFNWQAPDDLGGAVTFYLSVNDSNNNGGRTGDAIYISSLSIEEEMSTSVQDFISESINIFPNPTSGLISIATPTIPILEVALMNSTGQILLTQSNPTQLDISNYPSGIYFLSLTTPSGNGIKKILLK